MKFLLKIIIVFWLLMFTTASYTQPYVKFEEQPPMEITVKDRFIYNVVVKYNTPTNGTMYITLLKDGKAIGNSVHEVKRGKRSLKCNITIWKDQEITKKGEYEYRIQILEKPKEWDTTIAKADPITGVKAIKQKK